MVNNVNKIDDLSKTYIASAPSDVNTAAKVDNFFETTKGIWEKVKEDGQKRRFVILLISLLFLLFRHMS